MQWLDRPIVPVENISERLNLSRGQLHRLFHHHPLHALGAGRGGQRAVVPIRRLAPRQQLIHGTDLGELVRHGYLQVEGLRYEDFLPFSAAGIFASNLGQYGTRSTAADKPVYTQHTLEEIMGLKIIDPNVTYAGLQAESLLKAYADLGKRNDVSIEERNQWEQAVAAYRATVQA